MQSGYFLFELFTALAVFTLKIQRKEKPVLRILLAVLGIWLISLIIVIVNRHFNEFETYTQRTIFHTVFSCGILFIYMIFAVWLIFSVPLKEAVYCATCAYLTEHIVYCIRLIANSITDNDMLLVGSIWYFLLHLLVYIFSYYVFADKMVQEKHFATSAVQSLGLMVCVLFLVIVMSIASSYYGFEAIHGIYAMFCCVFVLYSQVKQQEQLSLQEELNINRQLWLKQKAQYETSKETIDIINSKCHDLKYQLAALSAINSPQKQRDIISSIESSVMIYDSIFKTGNDILDTVLTEKSLLCNKNNIVMTCIADGKILDFMDAVDLYTLFGNSLDNAMESVSQLDKEERLINLSIQRKASLIIIQIENRYKGELKLIEGIPATKKKDKDYHGFGVKSIMHIARKYNGFVTIQTENNIFLLRITIPAE